jgi:hypothetical protein
LFFIKNSAKSLPNQPAVLPLKYLGTTYNIKGMDDTFPVCLAVQSMLLISSSPLTPKLFRSFKASSYVK